jgi:hypothetical protein
MAYYQQAFLRDFLKQIRRRPGMYLIPGESIHALMNFLHGFLVGCLQYETLIPSNNKPESLNGHFMEIFGLWCQKKYKVGGAGYWNAARKLAGEDDRQQFHAFYQLLDEFDAELQKYGENMVITELISWAKEQDEKVKHWDD